MGSYLSSSLWAALGGITGYWRKPSRIAIVGLDGAGKSTLLGKLKGDDAVSATPTIGFVIETIQHKDIEFEVWDFGGQRKVRPIWKDYLAGVKAVIFVVDAADRLRIQEAAFELQSVMQHQELQARPLLVYANKQDCANCLSEQELTTTLKLSKMRSQPTHLQPSTALTGMGLSDGLEWLCNAVEGHAQ